MAQPDFISEWLSPSERVLLQTSGSTGTPKTFWADKSRMRASARMTCDFLGLQPGDNALLCLSTDYIAGKMMVVRALERRLNLISVAPSNRPLEALQEQYPDIRRIDLAAMVPSQVFCSIGHPLLRQIRHLIIGGGAVSPELEEALRALPNAVWSSYGMTETLSHIALRRISGAEAQEWYTPLPGVSVSLNSDGCLCIDAPALSPQPLVTNDIAELSPSGSFRILGRRDNVIQSGGIKLQIEALEAQLRPLLAASDDRVSFCVTSRPSAKFGEEAVLLVLPELLPQASAIRHSYIKAVIPVKEIPLTPTGKTDRARAKALARML